MAWILLWKCQGRKGGRRWSEWRCVNVWNAMSWFYRASTFFSVKVVCGKGCRKRASNLTLCLTFYFVCSLCCGICVKHVVFCFRITFPFLNIPRNNLRIYSGLVTVACSTNVERIGLIWVLLVSSCFIFLNPKKEKDAFCNSKLFWVSCTS